MSCLHLALHVQCRLSKKVCTTYLCHSYIIVCDSCLIATSRILVVCIKFLGICLCPRYLAEKAAVADMVHQPTWTYIVLRSLHFAPIIFAKPGDRTHNLTMILITTDHYTPYPKYRPWPRLSHSLMAVHLMFISCQIHHHAYHTATHLGTSCISSPLYDPYLASCSSHVLPLILHDSPSSYRVWSTYLGYAPHGLLMYYRTGYL